MSTQIPSRTRPSSMHVSERTSVPCVINRLTKRCIHTGAHCLKDDSEIATSLRIAVATYRELQQKSDAQPTEITYFTFLVALQNLVPVGPKRTQAAFDVFQKAMDCGYVNHRVVSRIKCKCASRQIQSIFVYGSNVLCTFCSMCSERSLGRRVAREIVVEYDPH